MQGKKENQKGQTLIIVILTMMMALAVGISVSSRFLKSVNVTTRSDSSNRSLAVAEALAERLLVKPYATLKGYIDFGNCGTECALTINGEDGISATAGAVLSYVGNSTSALSVSLKRNKSIEVDLTDYTANKTLSVCWNNPSTGGEASITGFLVYGNGSSTYVLSNFAYNSLSSVYSSNGFSQAATNFGYTNCFNIAGQTTPKLLRLKSVYNDVDAFVIPAPGVSLPIQGILIKSTGSVKDLTRVVSVIKSAASLPTSFDYAIQMKSTTTTFSN
ncbi:hypothetical protein A3H26_00735 [candidate division WWE3 bacterium RIFCSPLOWO2_12_FULL_36_10]|uniref:Type 4 fimbrial biogenesis protein PilX N-terminal domain-containing protein n=1 Tax=candidate division WWE3 bacterium RIFCSPLOWO2_12_FULL_36_10 TaxID=1802630 RepID=A0A1F4VLW4_UNCKA|nr:MAG: hypothetical protein A3H26_00735 [candidate division WWE3 bacterium RIFCSPLOWO2_12_FULL_36_10]